ncbi:hypothetical protein ACFLTJ_01720 [Chloroflexota bacterium]
MESRPIFEYILCGESFWFLKEVAQGRKIRSIITEINSLLACFENFHLPVTLRAANRLKTLEQKLLTSDPESDCTEQQTKELRDIVDELHLTFMAESSGNIAFIVTDKRINVNKLLNDAPSLLAPNVFDSLSDIARYDFIEAGQCIAFERPTAAAFHLLRATESILRQLYCLIVKRKRVALMWGPMVTHLRQRKRPQFGPLLDHLDHIRFHFRNPTQHPDKIYDIQEVQDLFGLCVDVVNRMVSIITSSNTG